MPCEQQQVRGCVGESVRRCLKDVVVVDLHATVDSKHEAAQGHAAGHAEEDVDGADATLLPVGEWCGGFISGAFEAVLVCDLS